MNLIDKKGLLTYIRSRYQLEWKGIHGPSHWARVAYWGQVMAEVKNGDPMVSRLFAWLHDVERQDDGHDPRHGYRSADRIQNLTGKYFNLSSTQYNQLCDAVRYHTDGMTSGDPVVQACWDSDRLDLYRVGIEPRRPLISTEAERFVPVAMAWSRGKAFDKLKVHQLAKL